MLHFGFFVASLLASAKFGNAAAPGATKYWFSFGDSYTQTGFDITSTKPTLSNTFGNPAFPGYTACGTVINWVDGIGFNLKGSTPLQVYNHAYGGATVDANLVQPYTPSVKSMTDQVNEFLNNEGTKPSYAPWASDTALFSIFIGINDLALSYYNAGDRCAFSDVILNAYFALVQKLYDQGGRLFLFITVPPVDRSPYMLLSTPLNRTLEKSVIDTYNLKLKAKVSAFAASHSGVQTIVYDSNAKLTQILNNPTAYGFNDATSYGNDYTDPWCNWFHVSPPVHFMWSTEIAPLLKSAGFLVQ